VTADDLHDPPAAARIAVRTEIDVAGLVGAVAPDDLGPRVRLVQVEVNVGKVLVVAELDVKLRFLRLDEGTLQVLGLT